jgi:voltage-gated potassium channel
MSLKQHISNLNQTRLNLTNKVIDRKYIFLLLSLISMLFIPSLFYQTPYQKIVAYVLQAFTFLIGVYAIHRNKNELYLLTLLCMVVIGLNLFGVYKEYATIHFYLSFIFYLLFYLFMCLRLVEKIVTAQTVRLSVLIASIIVYLLIGICGGFVFMLIENIHPGSIYNLQIENITEPSRFIYFSFTTMSTLGYGDITPVTPPAQSFAIILTVIGQMYTTLVVAMLVGRYLSHRNRN